WIPLVVLALPSILLMVVSFIVCQWPIHCRMLEHKQTKLDEIAVLLERLQSDDPGKIDKERREQIAFFQERMSRILAWPEWPFGWRSLLGSMGSGIIAASPM